MCSTICCTPAPDCCESRRELPQLDGDLGAHYWSDHCQSRGPGTAGGVGSAVRVNKPAMFQDLRLQTSTPTWRPGYTCANPIRGKSVAAVDGMNMASTRAIESLTPHLLSALPHAAGTVLTRPAKKRDPHLAQTTRVLPHGRGNDHRQRHANLISNRQVIGVRRGLPRQSSGGADLRGGGARGIRTPDLLIANETRYQLRHSPKCGPILASPPAVLASSVAVSPPTAPEPPGDVPWESPHYSPAARRPSRMASRSMGWKSSSSSSTGAGM